MLRTETRLWLVSTLLSLIFIIQVAHSWTYRAKSNRRSETLASFRLQESRDDADRISTSISRRNLLAISAATALAPTLAQAEITSDSNWPLWLALPVAPYARRKTLRQTVVPNQVWTFDQMIGIYYVQVPIRMTVVTNNGGLLVFAPVAPTKECLSLLQELIDEHGPVKDIILPSVAVEHKVNAGPFARNFPEANFYIVDKQYSFPIPLPNSFLGLPANAQPLPTQCNGLLGPDIDYQVLTVQPGPASMYQDVALVHKPSRTVLVCDALFAATEEPPAILTQVPEYTRALLFHARDKKDEMVKDTPANRRKGWRRIVLLFNFFFPGAGKGDLGPGPILQALQTPLYKDGWGGWMPYTWNADSEAIAFDKYIAGGKPLIYTVVQIILSRQPDLVLDWARQVARWDFERVIPAHLDAPIVIGPKEFFETFAFYQGTENVVRFCDEDVEFLRGAQEGFLSFSVYDSRQGPLQGKEGKCGL